MRVANECRALFLLALLSSLLPTVGFAAPAVRELTVGVVQFESLDGDVRGNLRTAERWLNQAVAAGAELVVFPELMPTGYQLSEAIWESGETMGGPTVRWMKRQSTKHQVWLGTSFLEVDGEHFYNTFVITSPKGQIAGTARKEVPASAEAYFFKGDVNDHVIDTELGRIGVMICYENYLTRIANKVALGEIDLLLSPFSFPELRGSGAQPLAGSEYASFYGAQLGVPVAAVNKVGRWRSPVAELPGYYTSGEFPGLSAIALAGGSIAAKADREAGFVVAKVLLDPAAKQSGVSFQGVFVAGLVGPPTATPIEVSMIRRRAAQFTVPEDVAGAVYANNERRRAKALRKSRRVR